MRAKSHLHIVNVLDFMESFNTKEAEKASQRKKWQDIRGVIVPVISDNNCDYELVTNSGDRFTIIYESRDRDTLNKFTWKKVRMWGAIDLTDMTISPKRIEPDRPAENTGVVLEFIPKTQTISSDFLTSNFVPLSA